MTRPEHCWRNARIQEYGCVVTPLQINLHVGASPGLLEEKKMRISETAEAVEANHEVGEKETVGEM